MQRTYFCFECVSTVSKVLPPNGSHIPAIKLGPSSLIYQLSWPEVDCSDKAHNRRGPNPFGSFTTVSEYLMCLISGIVVSPFPTFFFLFSLLFSVAGYIKKFFMVVCLANTNTNRNKSPTPTNAERRH